MNRRALFLDRDGVILVLCAERGPMEIAHKKEEVSLIPGIAELLSWANRHDWLAIVASNQPDVAKKKATLEDVQSAMREMEDQLKERGARLDRVYYCLHQSDPARALNKEYLLDCNCRKPHPGMLLQAAKEFDIDLARSVMVGDRLSDIEAGKAAGCKTVLFHDEQYHPAMFLQKVMESNIRPDHIVAHLQSVIELLR